MATRSAVIDAVEVALAGELDVDVYSPNRLQDVPAPGGDPDNPTTFIAWTLGAEYWDEERSTFGTRLYNGTVLFGLHTESGGGELDFTAYGSELEGLLIPASTADLRFFEAQTGDVIDDEAWAGRLLEVPYLRQEDKA